MAWRTERDGVTVVYSVFLSTITTNNKNNRVISFFDENFSIASATLILSIDSSGVEKVFFNKRRAHLGDQ